MAKNKNRRYRLSDADARKLGLVPNRSRRYRLNSVQEEQYLGKRIKRLFFDIETSPNIVYAWRIGYNINLHPESIIEERKIICISYKWEGDESVYHLQWDKGQDDKQMIADFIKLANVADELIGHNGDRFDIKWLRTRAIKHRLPMFPQYRTLDTLKKARSGFYFNSNKLDYIAKYLGVGAKTPHDGFDMWVSVMNGDEVALQKMVEYCDNDVVILEDVFHVLQNYIKPNTNVSVHTGGERYGCPVCGENERLTLQKNDVTVKGTIKRIIECDCGHVYDIANGNYLKFLSRN